MRTLSPALLAAQTGASRTPYLKVEASNKLGGAVRLDWERLYSGAEPDYFHALTMPGDGAMVRARITPPADGRKLYRQRVAGPAPGADFAAWTYTNQYNCVVVAAAWGAEVSIFWIATSREIRRIKSLDYGASWVGPELIDYSPTTAINGIAAAYKPNGDLALFFADQSTLYIKRLVSGVWQAKTAWDRTTGELSGVAAAYDADWKLLVSGRDGTGSFKLWSLVYGDGGEAAPGAWSSLKELATAPADGGFEFRQACLDMTDTYRCFYVEKYADSESYSRFFWSQTAPGAGFTAGLWREPVPFNLEGEYGAAMAHDGGYAWLASANGVWRASLAEQRQELTRDVIGARVELAPQAGRLTLELRNDEAQYAALPAPLGLGCRLEVSPGYLTAGGLASSAGLHFMLEAFEYNSAPGRSTIVLHGWDGWDRLDGWRARQPSRWNKAASELNARQILEWLLARAGLRLEVVSQSADIAGSYPDFAVKPGESGASLVRGLLASFPDVIFIEGDMAYLVHPLAADAAVYAYGQDHPVLEGKYAWGSWEVNRMQVEGYDPVGGIPVIVDAFDWNELDRVPERFSFMFDRNVTSVAQAHSRAAAELRRAEILLVAGTLLVPVNCGQQLYDVIDISDRRAGLAAVKRRVLGMIINYRPERAQYEQKLTLGMV